MNGKMVCQKCNKEFGTLMASCGTGYSWSLFKCPNCDQLHATKNTNGFFSKEALKDKNVICL
jgi:phage FluMu protein Com